MKKFPHGIEVAPEVGRLEASSRLQFKLKPGMREQKMKYKTGIFNALCKNCVRCLVFAVAEREIGQDREGKTLAGKESFAVEAAAIRLK